MLIPRRFSTCTLIAANMVPLVLAPRSAAGVCEILAFYWAESAILGGFNILKILSAAGKDKFPEPFSFKVFTSRDLDPLATLGSRMGFPGKVFIALIFAFPFSMYLGLYGLVLRVLFFESDWLALALSIRWWALGLLISHGVSFVADYLAAGEFQRTRSEKCLTPLFPRLAITNLILLIAAAAANLPGFWLALFVFICAKVVGELRYEAVCLLQADPRNISRLFAFLEDEALLKRKFPVRV